MNELTIGPRFPELRSLALDLVLRTRMKRRYAGITDDGLRRGAEQLRRALARAKVPQHVRVEVTRVGGRPAEWVHSGQAQTSKVVLYFHGGGFYMSSPVEHRALTWRLARACSCPVLAIEYRKAPDHQFPAWVDDALAAYRDLLQSGRMAGDIIVSGDSAGGNIALALSHRIRREGFPMPQALVLFSPWVDLLCDGESYRTNRRRDAMFDADAVRALGRYLTRACDARDPEVSPAYADFRGFPRMLVLAGSNEVFLDDARTVARRARDVGVAADLYVFRHMPHVFPMFAAYVPRAKSAFDLFGGSSWKPARLPPRRSTRTRKEGAMRGYVLERIALRALTRFGGSELASRFGLRAPAQRVLYNGAKAGTQAITGGFAAAKRAVVGEPNRLGSSKSSELFDLRPTEEQAIVRNAMRRFAEEVLRPAARAADDAASPPNELLARGHALGLAGLAIPEALGGLATERSAVTGALIAEELARGDMGLAVAILAPLAVVHAIVTWGTADQQGRYLPAFLGDRFVPAALALLESDPLFDPMQPRTGAVRSPDGGWQLWGEKSLVPLAATAELFVVAASVRGTGVRLFVIDRGTPGLTIEPQPAMGVRAAGLGHLRFEGARVGEDCLVGGEAHECVFDPGDLVDRSRIAWGAMAVGAGQAVLDYVVPYTKARHAFGEPISNRQAVAFLVADIAIELEGMRLLVHRAASRADRGAEVGRHAALARLQCASKGMKIGSDGVQLLGGHGFVKEHPVERWYRDLRSIGVFEGALLA